MEVKILIYSSPFELERQIKKWTLEYGYSLQGSVTMGTNTNGNIVYLATMIKGESE